MTVQHGISTITSARLLILCIYGQDEKAVCTVCQTQQEHCYHVKFEQKALKVMQISSDHRSANSAEFIMQTRI